MVWFIIVLTLALGPLQWITLADVGLQLKPVHVPFFLLSAVGWLRLVQGRVLVSAVRPGFTFASFYALYLVILIFSATINGSGFMTAIKYIIYFFGSLGWFFVLITMERGKVVSAVMWGGISAAVLFFIVALITLQMRGINMFSVVGSALTTGNPAMMQFMIFRNVFNAPGVSSEDAVGVALRHTSLGFIFIGTLISLANASRARVALAGAVFAVLIILVSVSRSQILALALALAPLAVSLPKTFPRAFLLGGLAAIVGACFVALKVDLSGVANIIEQRFGNFAEDGRVGMYGYAMGEINERLILGHGPGYLFDHGGARLHQVHNLFLGAWMQGGVLCLLAAIGFTVSLISVYLRGIASAAGSSEKVLMLGLLVLPLFRSQISGGGGNYTLPEWICIAVVFALAVPRTRSKRAGEPRTQLEGRLGLATQ